MEVTQIENWFTNEQYLVATPTGPGSALFVLDVDPEGQGWIAEHADKLLASGYIKPTAASTLFIDGRKAFKGKAPPQGLSRPE